MKGNGDCYQVAGNLIVDINDDKAFLCHGTATGQGPIVGIKHGHAWVELGDKVIDKSNGNNLCMDKDVYYRIGKIENVKRYSRKEAISNLIKTEHFGPWRNKNE